MAEKSASGYFTIEVKGHESVLMHNLNRARLEERLCDFKIQVGTQTIHAHKIVLAEGCDYFRAMLSHPMKEAKEGFVEMVDVDFGSLEMCVEYIYVGKITVMKEKLQFLLEVAHRLQLNELCKEAAENLEDDLSLDSLFTAKRVATLLGLTQLGEKCDDFALKNLPEIARLEDFVKIEAKYLRFLMTAEVPPAVKCKIFLIWANHDAENREKKFEEFFLNLDLHILSPYYVKFLELNEPLFFNSPKCLREVMRTKLPTGSGRDINLDTFQEYVKSNSGFAVFDLTSNAIQAFDPSKKTWTKVSKLTPAITSLDSFTAIVVGEDIFVFAEDQRNWKLRYSDKNARWFRLPNRTLTKKASIVEVDGLIYAFDETGECSKAVEVYDGSQWLHITDKPIAGYQTYIVTAEHSICCIGGINKSEYFSHCYKYETRKKCWSTFPSMPEKRSRGSAAELDRKIYVIGGYDCLNKVIATALVFDTETEVWTEIAKMTNPRYDFCAIPVIGKIFAIGGTNSWNTVEEFDPVTGKWRIVLTLSGKEIVSTASVAL